MSQTPPLREFDYPSHGPLSEARITARAFAAVVRDPMKAMPAEIYREPVVAVHLGGRKRLYLMDPGLIHQALVGKAGSLGKGDQVRRAVGPALGQGLLTADGAHWRWQRQSVASAFRPDSMQDLLPAMIEAAGRTRRRWQAISPGRVDIGHEMMRTTFDIIVETMMSGGNGIDVAAVERAITDYLKPIGWVLAFGMFGAPDWVPYPGRTKARDAVEFLRTSLRTVVHERRAALDDRHDLVTMLLAAQDPETGRAMTDEEIVDNLMTFITAGHETTALALAWVFHLLAEHPDIEARVLEEIATVTHKGRVEADHVARLTYTRQVLFEAMRLYPPAPIITRTAIEDFTLADRLVTAGTDVTVPIHAVHRHQLLWNDPDRFDPERFAPSEVKARHRYAYMPFGAGPRVCIGSTFASLEAVAILAVLLPTFQLSNDGAVTPETVMRLTLRPKRSLDMRLSAR